MLELEAVVQLPGWTLRAFRDREGSGVLPLLEKWELQPLEKQHTEFAAFRVM